MATFYPGYWICPRCNSNDAYFSKRVVGMIGTSFDNSETPVNPGLARAIEQEVALCRECQERMKWVPEKTIYTPQEQFDRDNKAYKSRFRYLFGALFFGVTSIYLFSDGELGFKLVAVIPLFFAIMLFLGFSYIVKDGKPNRDNYNK